MEMNRPAFGNRPPKSAPALKLGRLLARALPSVPDQVDHGGSFTGWLTLGNVGSPGAGDCDAVAWANQRALATTVLTGETEYPDQDQV